MTHRRKIGVAITWVALIAALPTSMNFSRAKHVADKSAIPPAPPYYVLDEAGLLTSQQKKALETILIEHDHLADQQIIFGIFKNTHKEDITERTHAIFDAWQVGKRGRDAGALLAFYNEEGKASFEVGYGLESEFSPKEAKDVVSRFLMPEIRVKKPYRGFGLSLLEILRELQSPLIESGRAQQILSNGGWEGTFRPTAPGAGGWYIWLILGVIFFVATLMQLLTADAHFTSEGWFRPKPQLLLLSRIRARSKASRDDTADLGGIDGNW